MKKIEYSSPKMKIVVLKHRTNLLQASEVIDGPVGYRPSEETTPKA